eukprot:ANDGO_02392.mRNA.1 Regulation of enolase protein 1
MVRDWKGWHWVCEPEADRWSLDELANTLTVSPSRDTDFWQRTHYGFRRDNAHLFCISVPLSVLAAEKTATDARDSQETPVPFVLSAHVSFSPLHQYDQAGLCVRVNENCWIKTSIEYESAHEPARLGVVVTNNGYSDWSTQDVPNSVRSVWLRISSMFRNDFLVEYAFDNSENSKATDALKWHQMRVAHLFVQLGGIDDQHHQQQYAQLGVYACCPVNNGYKATFSSIECNVSGAECKQ